MKPLAGYRQEAIGRSRELGEDHHGNSSVASVIPAVKLLAPAFGWRRTKRQVASDKGRETSDEGQRTTDN